MGCPWARVSGVVGVLLSLVIGPALTQPSGADPGTIRFSGRVVDQEGHPVEGAATWVCTFPAGQHRPIPFLSRELEATREDGRFVTLVERVPNIRHAVWPDAWECWIAAYKLGHGAGWVRLDDVLAAEEADIALGEACSLEGCVRDADGALLSQVAVSIDEISLPPFAEPGTIGNRLVFEPFVPRPPWTEVRTDEKGRFVLSGLPAEGVIRLSASTCGAGVCYREDQYCPDLGEIKLADLRGPMTISLVRESIIEGSLLLPGDRPAAGVAVHGVGIARGDPYTNYMFTQQGGAQVVTDEDGRFRVRLRTPGAYTLWTSDQEWYGLIAQRVEVGVAATVTLSPTVLQMNGRIEGRVLDVDAREPVGGARVHCRPYPIVRDLMAFIGGHADDQGRYSIAAPPGEVLLEVNPPPGYTSAHRVGTATRDGRTWVSVTQDPERPSYRVLTISPGEVVGNTDLFVTRQAELTGLVLGPDGKPWRHGGHVFGVLDRDQVESKIYPSHGGSIQPDGTFQARCLFPDVPVVLSVYDAWRKLAGIVAVTPPRGETTNVTIHMRPVSRLVGRVLSPDGSPVAGAEVRVRYLNLAAAPSDATGHFKVDGYVGDVPCVVYAFFPPLRERADGGSVEWLHGESRAVHVPSTAGPDVVAVGDIGMEAQEPVGQR